MQKLFDFHTKFALRFLKASPPHMREWGWNQMDGLLSLTQRHCWSPRAVRVRREKKRHAAASKSTTNILDEDICMNACIVQRKHYTPQPLNLTANKAAKETGSCCGTRTPRRNPPTCYFVIFTFNLVTGKGGKSSSIPHVSEVLGQKVGKTSIFSLFRGHPRKVQGAGSPELDGVYRVSRNDATGLREKAYFVSAKTLASSMPPQNRTPPRYIHEGGTNELSLSQNCEGRSLWYIR